jgi:hypothetical protein
MKGNQIMRNRNTIFTTILLACFGFLPGAKGVVPPPDGGYPGGNTAEGQNALLSLTTGSFNTAVGWFSLQSNITSNFNTALGAGTLLYNIAESNTAIGAGALLFNTTGEANTASGTQALFSNDAGNANTATGDAALYSNIEGSDNTASGTAALFFNTGSRNTASGRSALFDNTSGGDNTATGYSALFNNTIGTFNTANGDQALFSNTEGAANTAVGFRALLNNTTGTHNTVIGSDALVNNTTGNSNIALGVLAGGAVTNANNVIAIGISGENVGNSCYIGQIYSNVQPQVGTDPDLVTINSDGRLGRANVSSRRYKHDIQPMHTASEAIYALNPVTFRYHEQYDRTQTIAFGLIAEEVAKVNPDLVGRNPEGQPESVRYEQINAMLLNEFLKAHKIVEEQQATIAQLKKEVATVVARLNEHDSKIQRVSDQVQINSPESPLVVSDP